MKRPFLLVPLLALGALAWTPSSSVAQGVGSRVEKVELEGYAQTGAKSFADYQGRAVLIEFFAYW